MPVNSTPWPAVARQRVGRVGDQEVDLACLQGRETLRRRERDEFHLVGVAQDGGGHGTADVDGEARPFALAVRLHEAGRRSAEAAYELASRLHAIEDGPRIGAVPE